MSTFRAPLESIVSSLTSVPLDLTAVERSAPALSELGQTITSHLEIELDTLMDDAEDNAA